MLPKTINKDFLIIIYKLSYDVLALALLVFFGAMIVENIIPTFISSHVSFFSMLIAICMLFVAMTLLGKHLNISFSFHSKKPLLIPIVIIIAYLLIGNSMLRLPLWQNQIITLLLAFIIYQFYLLVFQDSKK